MSRALRRVLVAATALASPQAVAQAATQAPPDRVRLVYEAPPDCPTAETFDTEVRSRVSSGWEASPGELAREIHVNVSRSSAVFVARIEFLDRSGERVTRMVSGTRCEEVANGAALVTALAIQSRVPEAIERSEAPPLAALEAAAIPLPSVPRSPEPGAERGAAVTRSAASPPFRFRFGARGSLVTGVGPEAAVAAGGFFALESGRSRFGLAVDAVIPRDTTANGVDARFDLTSARLEACPWAIALFGTSAFEPCGSLEFGVLGARSLVDPPQVVRASRGSVAWVAPGAVGRVVLGFEPVVVELELAGRVPLRRERFYVEIEGERHVTFRVPALSGGAALGVGLHF